MKGRGFSRSRTGKHHLATLAPKATRERLEVGREGSQGRPAGLLCAKKTSASARSVSAGEGPAERNPKEAGQNAAPPAPESRSRLFSPRQEFRPSPQQSESPNHHRLHPLGSRTTQGKTRLPGRGHLSRYYAPLCGSPAAVGQSQLRAAEGSGRGGKAAVGELSEPSKAH